MKTRDEKEATRNPHKLGRTPRPRRFMVVDNHLSFHPWSARTSALGPTGPRRIPILRQKPGGTSNERTTARLAYCPCSGGFQMYQGRFVTDSRWLEESHTDAASDTHRVGASHRNHDTRQGSKGVVQKAPVNCRPHHVAPTVSNTDDLHGCHAMLSGLRQSSTSSMVESISSSADCPTNATPTYTRHGPCRCRTTPSMPAKLPAITRHRAPF